MTSTTSCPVTPTNGFLTETRTYLDTGMVSQSTDLCGHPSTFQYAQTPYAGAFPTSACDALNHCTTRQYDLNSGLVTNVTDPNNQPSNYTYDNLGRLTNISRPDGGQTNVYYPDPTTVEVKKLEAASTPTNIWIDHFTYYDGLLRPKQTRLVDPEGDDYTETTYDPLGHVATVTNPHRTAAAPTDGITTNTYDTFGRITQITRQDGSIALTSYSDPVTVTVTDEAGHQRRSTKDALGRLTSVVEDPAGLNYETDYQYDLLDNLLRVDQKGSAPTTSGQWRTRLFTYDSLSRLLTATNPESGTINYSYDADGNVLQKTSPAPNQTSSATQTISYCYDALNRVTGKAYLAQSCPLSSPAVTRAYDSGTNGIGHLTSLTDQAGSGSYSYDPMGRIATESRAIAGITKSMSYLYNLDGSIQKLTYPSGAVITYTPDAAGRMLSALDNGNHINYVTGSGGPNSGSGATYAPDGSILSFNQGWTTSFAGIANSFSYNSRLQPVNMAAMSPGSTGTSATASVTIAGVLKIGPTTGGTVPLPSSGTKLVGFQEADGTPHAFYQSTNQHIIHLFQSSSGTWQAYDVTANSISGNTTNHQPQSGTPLAGLANPGGYANSFYFLDANQHIHETYDHNDNVWYDNDFTTRFGLVAAAPGTPLLIYPGSGSIDMHLHYVGTDQHIHDVHHNTTTGWSDMDVTANSISGNTTNHQPASATALTGLLNPGGYSVSFYFLDANQHIHETYCHNDEVWYDNDFMTLFALGPAAAGTALTIYPGSGTIDMHLNYLGADGHIHDGYHNTTTGWAGYDITANATQYQGISDQPAAGTSLMGFAWPGGGSQSVYYLDPNQHIHEAYDHSDEKWTDVDYVGILGIGQAGAGSALAGYLTSPSMDAHVHYLKANQHLYDMRHSSSGTGWSEQDVNTVAQVAVPDSGTVSLTVGGFTATACFGPSTNAACNGQPVNYSLGQVASALAQALNVSGSPVNATASSATINMTWKATGQFTTPVGALSTTHDNPSLFPNPSFTSTATNFSGGSGANVAVLNLTYDFHVGAGDNGNVFAIANNKDTTRSQTFTYDALNRLISAQNAGTDCTKKTLNPNQTQYWGNSYGYDAWGNLLQKTVTKCQAEYMNYLALANNQLQGLGYDAAGNMTKDNLNQSFTYDPENRITGAPGFSYTYDADGNRVEKSNGTTGTLYWYMTPGIVAESDLKGNLQSEYVFFDGERVARKDFPSNAVSYYFSDHLKTTDIVTDPAGNIRSESDYYPWGGELSFLANDSNHYKFTGKERDSETQLDYFGARYYSNGLGRFISADWSATPMPVPYADFGDPQTLNLYGYVRGLPTTRMDIDGHDDGFWNDVLEASAGFVRGAAASVSFGAVGAPKSTDSDMSLLGQSFGTAMVAHIGMQEMSTGILEVGGGLAGAPETEGASLGVSGVGALEAVGGAVVTVGAAKNAGAILNAMAARNPYGSRGAPDHQEKVGELVDKAKSEAKPGETVQSNTKVKGLDSNRKPDAQIINARGKTRKAFEAERHPNSARNKMREAEYKRLKLKNETHPLN